MNLPEGKNLVGTFAQPRLVVADVDTLATLSGSRLPFGLAEVAKYALTLDLELLEKLERGPRSGPGRRDPDALVQWAQVRRRRRPRWRRTSATPAPG